MHALRDDQIHRAGQQTHDRAVGKKSLSVEIDNVLAAELDCDVLSAQVGDELRQRPEAYLPMSDAN